MNTVDQKIPMSQQPLVVISAPNGARLRRQDHASVPLTPHELADCAQALLQVGVSVLHLHVRDDDGGHSLDADRYRAAINQIQNRVGNELILQITTESVGKYNRHQQMALVRELKPEAVSLALRELCPDENSIEEAGAFFQELSADGIWPQYILYSPEEVLRFESLHSQGVFGDTTPFALFVLGRYNDSHGESLGRASIKGGVLHDPFVGNPEQLRLFVKPFDKGGFIWAACCFGATEHLVMRSTIALGGHVRIGFENNRLLPNGNIAESNAELIQQTLAMNPKNSINRPIATADWVRKHLIVRN